MSSINLKAQVITNTNQVEINCAGMMNRYCSPHGPADKIDEGLENEDYGTDGMVMFYMFPQEQE